MFTKALNFIKGLFGSAGVIAPILTLFGVAIPPVAIAAIPMAIGLMTAAEDALGDGTGAIKKSAVTAGVTAFADQIKAVSTGGQAETWNAMTPDVVSALIDTIATTANQIADAAGSAPVFDETKWNETKGVY